MNCKDGWWQQEDVAYIAFPDRTASNQKWTSLWKDEASDQRILDIILDGQFSFEEIHVFSELCVFSHRCTICRDLGAGIVCVH